MACLLLLGAWHGALHAVIVSRTDTPPPSALKGRHHQGQAALPQTGLPLWSTSILSSIPEAAGRSEEINSADSMRAWASSGPESSQAGLVGAHLQTLHSQLVVGWFFSSKGGGGVAAK